jgi:PhoD-like phosphatase
MQDWQLNDGRMECTGSGGNRNVYLLTHDMQKGAGALDMSVKLGVLKGRRKTSRGWMGFRVGVHGQFDDYRDSAVCGVGLRVGIHTDGRLFIGEYDSSAKAIEKPLQNITLKLNAVPNGKTYIVTLTAYDDKGNLLSRVCRDDIDPNWLMGGLSLACSAGKITNTPAKRPSTGSKQWRSIRAKSQRGGNVRFWFSDWEVSGSKIKTYPKRAFGPILFAQYILSDSTMKMTAQMPPIGPDDSQYVKLQVKKNRAWKTLAKEKIDLLARTATFRIEKWNSRRDIPYRLAYLLKEPNGKTKEHYYEGVIRKEPLDKKELVVAAFCCQGPLGFPNNDLVKHLAYHNPDFLYFAGDQIYESVGGYGTQRAPLDMAVNDYLRKWFIFGWTWREIMRDRPSITIPDDHDVYHGNLWGCGGRAVDTTLSGAARQDSGGFKMPPEWVNMVQRTQTSHLPDPYDPMPVDQFIDVYYCNVNYAGISFAVLEDRKFKSAPKELLPGAEIWNGWPQSATFSMKTQGNHPDAILLGERQLNFLNNWAKDWDKGIWAKVVLSQTPFATVATLPASETSDANVPRLPVLKADEYPVDDKPTTDCDSNGWPQGGRDKALREIRRAFALHISGDQHLGTTVQYGIDDWRDAGFGFCVPAISNVWPRRWYPTLEGANREADTPRYTGDYEDGFGNKVSVHAVANPSDTGLQPALLYNRATGYGIIRYQRASRDIVLECWPRLSNPATGGKQNPGWPLTINQMDNYGRKAWGYLPTIQVKGITDPVVQIIEQSSGEAIYTVRISGTEFQPKVFKAGKYTVRVGPSTDKMKIKKDISANRKPDTTNRLDFHFKRLRK